MLKRVQPWRHLAAIIGLSLLSAYPASAADDAAALIRKQQDRMRADRNVGTYTMEIVRPGWRRSLRLKSWDDRPGKRFFIHILAPEKERDTTFLKTGGNLWMYKPKLERDFKIPPSMMLNSWMGSDFSNDDLVKASSIIDDYSHRILKREGSGAHERITIESVPKPDAPVVWGKLVTELHPDGTPLAQEFYDEAGTAVKRLRFSEVKTLGGRTLPTRWQMATLAEPGSETVMTIDEIAFDSAIPASMFQRDRLSRPRAR